MIARPDHLSTSRSAIADIACLGRAVDLEIKEARIAGRVHCGDHAQLGGVNN
jgi:hypothetical protein